MLHLWLAPLWSYKLNEPNRVPRLVSTVQITHVFLQLKTALHHVFFPCSDACMLAGLRPGPIEVVLDCRREGVQQLGERACQQCTASMCLAKTCIQYCHKLSLRLLRQYCCSQSKLRFHWTKEGHACSAGLGPLPASLARHAMLETCCCTV